MIDTDIDLLRELESPTLNTIQEECGDSRISLDNAEVLMVKYGLPHRMKLKYDSNEWFKVEAEFDGYGTHTFTGLSWGYTGEGCRAFLNLMRACGFDLDMDYVSKLNRNNPKPDTWIPQQSAQLV